MGHPGGVGGVVEFHYVPAAAESTYRKAAADDLAQGGHVGGYPVVFLGAAGGHAEANHLVEYED